MAPSWSVCFPLRVRAHWGNPVHTRLTQILVSMFTFAMQKQWHVFKRVWIQPTAQATHAKNRIFSVGWSIQGHIIGKHPELSLGHLPYE